MESQVLREKSSLGLARSHTPRNITAVIETSSAALSEGSLAIAPKSKRKPVKKSRTRTLPLPDPKFRGPYRPFNDPGRDEAWWWLGLPICAGLFVIISFRVAPQFYHWWVAREGPGILETAQFLLMVMGFAIAVQLLLDPFVRARPLVLAVTLLAAFT